MTYIEILNSSLFKKAVLAFNIQSLNQLTALIKSSEETSIPVIAQFSPRYYLNFDKIIGFNQIIKKYKKENIFFHLDHCIDLAIIKRCIDIGFDSIMYDGSSYPIEKNILETKEIMNYAKKHNCLVEGEVGSVDGEEDGKIGNNQIANIKEALLFTKETNVDLLALGIGNAHGVYQTTNNVNIELLNDFQTQSKKDIKLVLHGTTGLDFKTIEKSISFGVVKINYSTNLKIETQNIISSLKFKNDQYDDIYFNNYMVENLKNFFIPYLTRQ